jgi:hypothetical protein
MRCLQTQQLRDAHRRSRVLSHPDRNSTACRRRWPPEPRPVFGRQRPPRGEQETITSPSPQPPGRDTDAALA